MIYSPISSNIFNVLTNRQTNMVTFTRLILSRVCFCSNSIDSPKQAFFGAIYHWFWKRLILEMYLYFKCKDITNWTVPLFIHDYICTEVGVYFIDETIVVNIHLFTNTRFLDTENSEIWIYNCNVIDMFKLEVQWSESFGQNAKLENICSIIYIFIYIHRCSPYNIHCIL